MTGSVFDVVLLVAVLLVAVTAVVAPRRVAATSAFLVFGILLAVLWARLDAPDIALAEAALGGGVAGALLVDALGSPPPAPGRPARRPVILLAGALGAAAAAALVWTVTRVSDARSPLADEVLARIPETGVSHPITAVLLNYRSYDTLLEIAVLVVAALGAVSLARRDVPAPAAAPPAVRALAVVLLPVLTLLGVWILVAGTSRPGGAFQAGALLGAGLIIAHLAGVRIAGPRGRIGLAVVGSGLVAFIAVGAVTAVAAGGWFRLDPAWAGAVILGVESLLTVSIAAGLALMFLANRVDDLPARTTSEAAA